MDFYKPFITISIVSYNVSKADFDATNDNAAVHIKQFKLWCEK